MSVRKRGAFLACKGGLGGGSREGGAVKVGLVGKRELVRDSNVHVVGSGCHAIWQKQKARAALPVALALATFGYSRGLRAEPSELDPSVGYNYSEIEIPRIAATGGAQRALSTSIGALFMNPANIAVGDVYHVGAFAQLWPEARRQSYGAAATDSLLSPSGLAGGVGATYNFQDPDGVDRTWTDVRFALAYPFSDKLFIGVGGRYLWLKEDGSGPLLPSRASAGLRGKNIVESLSFDAGATFKPIPALSISVVGNNLGNPGHGFLPTSFGGGIGLGQESFALEADLVMDFTTYGDTKLRGMGGAEVLIAEHYAIRGGYRYDQGASSHALSFGAGYIEPAFLVDVAVRRVVSGDAATTVVLGFTYHLESTGLTPSNDDF